MTERRKALITGASRGIGRAICVKLASEGTDIVFSYRSGDEAASETVNLCREYGIEIHAIKADVSNSEECERLIREAVDLLGGRIDILVNNAGITKDNLIGRMKDEDFDAVIDVNLKGTFYMMRGVSRLMLRQRAGRIINMSSVVGVMGNAGQVNYSASKAGVIGMTKSLARELASRHITVNAVAPGMIETDMTGAMSDAVKEKVVENIPFKEMGKPEDIAHGFHARPLRSAHRRLRGPRRHRGLPQGSRGAGRGREPHSCSRRCQSDAVASGRPGGRGSG